MKTYPKNIAGICYEICDSFNNLSNLNQQLYDFWISKLYDEDGDLVKEMWTEETATEMYKDVMMQLKQWTLSKLAQEVFHKTPPPLKINKSTKQSK